MSQRLQTDKLYETVESVKEGKGGSGRRHVAVKVVFDLGQSGICVDPRKLKKKPALY